MHDTSYHILLITNMFRSLSQSSSVYIYKVLRIPFDVRKSVHHHTIQTIQPTRCNSFASLLLDVYVWLNMFRASPRPSSGECDCTRSLWFYRWSVAVAALLVVVWPVISCQTTTNNAPAASLQRWNQRLLVQLYAPDDGREEARNMLSHT